MSGDPSILDVVDSCVDYGREGIDEYRLKQELGIDPSLPAARLAEDLAIAARVRACSVHAYGDLPGDADVRSPSGDFDNAIDLLGWLLNGDTP